MAAKRLTYAHRRTMHQFAEDALSRELIDKTAALYTNAEKLVLREVRKQYPTRDINVLKKYALTRDVDEFRCQEGPNFIEFVLRDGTTTALPSGVWRDPILVGAPTFAAIEKLNAAVKKIKAQQDQTRRDYGALIDTATTFEAVIKHWPAAEAMAERIVGTRREVSTLSDDALKHIQQTNLDSAAA